MTPLHYTIINIILSTLTISFFCLFIYQSYQYVKFRHASVAKQQVGVRGEVSTTPILTKSQLKIKLWFLIASALLCVLSVAGIFAVHYYTYIEIKQYGAAHAIDGFFVNSGALTLSVLAEMMERNPLIFQDKLEETARFVGNHPAFKHPIETDVNVCWELLLSLYARLLHSIRLNMLNMVLVNSNYFYGSSIRAGADLWNGFVNSIFADGISLWLVALTFFVIFALIIGTREDKTAVDTRKQLILAVIVGILSTVCFLTRDLLVFFMSFEATLVPLFLLVGYFGSRSEKIRAATFLFVFTLVGSAFLWAGLLYCYAVLGVTNFDGLGDLLAMSTNGAADIVFWCLVLGFAFKVPVFLLHVWLTVAHVEAPTVGSVLLAGLVLKLGGYGLLRWVVLLLPVQTVTWGVYITWFCMVGYVIATLFAVHQSDLKRFVAYTSISHMNFGAAVLFNHTDIGILAYLHTMVSHGIIATALFMLVGFIYYQAGCRDSLSVNALSTTAPRFAMLWFLFVIANAGIPVFSAFPGEFFGLVSLMESNGFMLFFIAFVGFFVTAVYSFVVLIRVLYGTLGDVVVSYTRDINHTLNLLMYVLLGLSVFLGMSPDVLFRTALIDLTPDNNLYGYGQNLAIKYGETHNYMVREIYRRVGASVIYERTSAGLQDFYARQIQWVHSAPQRLAIHRFVTELSAFMFMGSINDKVVVQDIIDRIRLVTTTHRKALLTSQVDILNQFALMLELSQSLGQSPLPTEAHPELKFGNVFTNETCCDATMYDAWYCIVHTWGPKGIMAQILEDGNIYKVVLVDIILCDQSTPALMYRPQDIYTERAEIMSVKLKDVNVDVGPLNAQYIAKLNTLPPLENPKYLQHKPKDFSQRCIKRYPIQNTAYNMPRQPNPRTMVYRKRYY